MINCLIWNIRGVANDTSRLRLKSLTREHNIQILIVIEPKVDGERLEELAFFLKFSNYLHDDPNNHHIWLLWRDPIQISLHSSTNQVLNTHINIPQLFCTIAASFVYAKCSRPLRKELWQDLLYFQESNHLPWMIGGDFNVVAAAHEKRGPKAINQGDVHDFNSFILDAGLSDAGFQGNDFTWCNDLHSSENTWERLDRVMYDNSFLQFAPSLSVAHLTRTHSDHCPLLLSLHNRLASPSSFKFFRMWTTHDTFMQTVENSWNEVITGEPFIVLHRKLKRLKLVLKKWNKEIFGNIHATKFALETKVAMLENQIQQQWTAMESTALQSARIQLEKVLDCEELFLQDQARILWAKDGDRNTSFFHHLLKARKARPRFVLQGCAGLISEQSIIEQKAIEFYSDLLSTDGYPDFEAILDCVPSVITNAHNDKLTALPSAEEIHEAVVNLSAFSAPGPDGFTGHFFSTCWGIIHPEVIAAVQDFFRGCSIPLAISSTLLVLIPKIPNPTSFSDLRPISLCNFTHKIISKILANRISAFLPLLITPQQTAFVPGRTMHESIALAHELVEDIDFPNNTIFKLDMSKAFDRVEWPFLLACLRKLGFNETWCDLIYRNISNIHYSISLNGSSFGYFKSSRGLRQGDPLSPILFIISQDVLSRNLSKAFDTGLISHYLIGKGNMNITHLFFADDSLIFANSTPSGLNNLIRLIQSFSKASGQCINSTKSSFSLDPDRDRNSSLDIASLTGFSPQELPFRYLGVPLFKGRIRSEYLFELTNSILSRIEGWKARSLSFGGKVTLIKSVLCSITVHSLTLLAPPKPFLRMLEKLLATFLWSRKGIAKFPWIAWKKICRPIEHGGLGIRRLDHIAKSLHGKMAWKMILRDSLWADFMAAKYGNPLRPQLPHHSSRTWRIIVKHLKVIIPQTKLIIGSGSSKFWFSPWTTHLIPPPIPGTEAVSLRQVHDTPSLRRTILPLMPPRTRNAFFQLRFSTAPDHLVWTPSPTGDFSATSYGRHIRVEDPPFPWYNLFWNSHIPTNLAALAWRILHHGLPTDDRLQKVGIKLVSKCRCCAAHPARESQDHLILNGEISAKVWQRLSTLLLIPAPASPILTMTELFAHWLQGCLITAQEGFLKVAGFFCGLKAIWDSRNSVIHKGANIDPVKTLNITFRYIATLNYRYTPKMHSGTNLRPFCTAASIMLKAPPPKLIRHVTWTPPCQGFKLNTDGSSIGESITGGGILRDTRGKFIIAFSCHLGTGSNMLAEVEALNTGIQLCFQLGYPISEIEIDSYALMLLILKPSKPPWQCIQTLAAIKQAVELNKISVKHVLREGNGVADALANHAHLFPTKTVYIQPASLPSRAIQALHDNREGKAFVRIG